MNNMLDNAAACRPYPWAAELFAEKSLELFANQESAGELGVKAAKEVELAGEQLASAVAPGYGVLFCNTATDALRAAVRTALNPGKESLSLTTKAEHPALLHALKDFSSIQYCKIGKDGKALIPADAKADLIAVYHVNAETGIIQDVQNLKQTGSLFLLDTTQSLCKIPVPVNTADFLTVSGCKVGAPCGAALLYRKKFEKQVKSLRLEEHGIGRCVPASAVVLAEVISKSISALPERMAHAEKLRDLLRESLSGLKVVFTAKPEESSPWINHLMLPGYQGGILVRMFQEKGITVAAGSACSSETPEPSAVLRAMGYSAAEAYSALRVSFSDDTTPEEVLFFTNTLRELLKNY